MRHEVPPLTSQTDRYIILPTRESRVRCGIYAVLHMISLSGKANFLPESKHVLLNIDMFQNFISLLVILRNPETEVSFENDACA